MCAFEGGSESIFERLSKAQQEVARLAEKVKQQKKRLKKAEFEADHNRAMFLSKLEMDSSSINSHIRARVNSSDDDDDDGK